jgi:Glycosyl hydrolases family 15
MNTLLLCALVSALHPAPKTSVKALVSSNGYSTLQYSVTERHFDRFLQHPYKFESQGVPTRDLLSEAFYGVSHAAGRGWLPQGETLSATLVPGTGIIEVTQVAAGVRVKTYAFTPRGLAGAAFVLIAQLDNTNGSALSDVTLAFHLNQKLGDERPEPAAIGESIQYNLLRRGYEEYGAFQHSASASAVRALGATQRTSGGNGSATYPRTLLEGGQRFPHGIDDSSTAAQYNADDIGVGYAWSFGNVDAGASRFAAVVVSYDQGNIVADAWGRLDDWLAGDEDPETLLAREIEEYDEIASLALPDVMPNAERALYKQSVAFMKMAQVKESGRAYGQLLASLSAATQNDWNQWNITWVRDMAFATTALAESGQHAEARAALEFQLRAQVGRFTAPEFVGRPYQISLCRYFGNGTEESDDNENGPNIEYDGFGLFLWSLGRYVAATNDLTLLQDYWPVVKDRIADVLVSLIEPYSGLVRADSSIWETHWNGHQRQFAYTTLVGIAGLCEMGKLADKMGDPASGRFYRNTARQMRRAVSDRLTDDKGVIASSVEERAMGREYYDAAVIEAVAMRLFDPKGREARATIDAIFDKLSISSERGLFRNDEHDDYDKQEWVFINLRMVVALLMTGDPKDLARAERIYAWVVAQAGANGNIISELYNPALEGAEAYAYAGSVPMVGFGAGAYVLAAHAKYEPLVEELPCGGYDNTLETLLSGPAAPASGTRGEDDDSTGTKSRGCSQADGGLWLLALGATHVSRHLSRRSCNVR